MKKTLLPVCCLILCTLLSGCSLIEDAFKTGVWLVLILVAIVVGVLVWIFHFSYHRLANRYPGLGLYVNDLLNQ